MYCCCVVVFILKIYVENKIKTHHCNDHDEDYYDVCGIKVFNQ